MNIDPEGLPAGVREIEHTADVGLEIEADTLETLFHRAAAGTMALVREPGGAGLEVGDRTRDVVLAADGVDALLLRWLREILYVQETEDFAYAGAEFERLDASGLRASIRAARRPAPRVRELKGVTWHGLEVRQDGARWRARVIFDI